MVRTRRDDDAARDAVLAAIQRVVGTGSGPRGEVTVGEALSALTALMDSADGLLFDLVAAARSDGATWAEIGPALGVTAQAAHQRFAKRLSRHPTFYSREA